MNEWLELWQEANKTEFGIVIKTLDVRRFQKVMYEARKGYSELNQIQMCMVGDEIWLVKETARELLDGTTRRANTEDQS